MDNLPIDIADIVVIVIVLISAIMAYARGFVHEVLSISGWIGAGFITVYGFPEVQPYARDFIPIDLVADLAVGVILFIVSLLLLSLLTRAISKRVQGSAMNTLDRILGFLYGVVRGAVLVSIVYIAVAWMFPPTDQPAWLRNARTLPLIETGADMLYALIPEEAATAGKNAAGQANELIKNPKVIKQLITPEEPVGDATTTLEGYGRKIRSQMERLIDSNTE